MPDQRARWNVEAAASVIFPAPGPPKAPGMPEISPVDRDGFHAEEVTVLYRRDRGIMIAYKRFDPAIRPRDWAMFQSFVNGSMRWDPVSYQLPPPPQLRSSFVRPGIGIALLPEREAELPALGALLRRELPPGDDWLEKFMWGMLTGGEPLDTPVHPAELMDRAFANMIQSGAVVQQLRAHYAQLQTALDLKGMATMYLLALGKNA
jgi:hypothetical protein